MKNYRIFKWSICSGIGGQFKPEKGGQFAPERLVSLERNAMVNLTGFCNKCNKFVQDVLSENNAAPPGAWPPLAGTWANKKANIKGWTVVSEVHLGDVVAGAYPYTDASGHVVIVTAIDIETGYITTMGTVHSDYIGDSGYGNNLINNNGNHDGKVYSPIAIRRFTGF